MGTKFLKMPGLVIQWRGPSYEHLEDIEECGTEGGRGKKGGFSRLFRTLGSKKDKSSPRHMARLRAGGAAKASDAPPTTGACLPPLQPGDVLLGDEHCVQLMLAVRDGQLTMEQAVQRLRQRDTLRLRNHKNRDEMLNEFARSLLWTQNATKKTQANSIFYTDSCGGMHEPPIYYEPPDASPDCGGGIAHSRRICGGVPAPTCSTTLPRSVVLASPFKPPVSSSSTTTYSKSSGTSEVCDGNCGNIMCSVRAAAESSPSPPAEGITVLGGADEEIETETGCCDTVPEEEVALRTVPDVAHESELKRAAAAAGSEGAREGSSATRQAPSRGTSASRASGGSGGMLGRLRNITSRSSYTSEEGQSQSSDYEDQEEVDKMSESQKSQEQHRNSLVGRVRHIHQDVKKKISKFRNSRNSIDGSITDDKDAAEDCLQPGSSIESIPSGSAGSRSSLQANTPSSSNRSSIGEEDCTQCVGPIVGRARALVDNTPSPYDKDALPFKKGDIIDILSKNTTGTWVGVAHKKVGHFKFITVEEIPDETKPRQRKFPSVPKLDRRPDNLEEMLQMFGLQDYLNVLMLHGYQDLDIFKEVVKDDLDSLGITNHEHQLLIFQLAEMLLEYDGETLGEYTEVPSSPTPPQEQPAADSTQAPINNLDGGTEADDPDIQQSVDSTVNGVLGYELNITVAEGEAVNEGGHNGQERRPIPRTFHQDFSTASREEEDTAGEQGLDERLSESPARIPLSYARKVKSSTLTRQDDAGGRKVTRPPSMPLRACIEHKLAAEGIDLCREPYTDLTGFCGIPPALVQRYSEELQRDVAEIANALDQVRITELGERGRHGIPNDFLADSCLGPIADADYSSLHSWLVSLGLPMYEPLFAESHITDIARVAELREADFRAMGIGNARHVRLLSSAVGAMHLEQSHVTFR
ncbi:SAM and SH3 domain-containing protein 1-like isoform X3 [Ornithodoros turicata]|uniref:SAM and SH3 domain-containing protein 1-like isoform X3 n=1 Tax=Ornithodoros turicata TaxID=34597 RepID=UPI003139E3DD